MRWLGEPSRSTRNRYEGPGEPGEHDIQGSVNRNAPMISTTARVLTDHLVREITRSGHDQHSAARRSQK